MSEKLFVRNPQSGLLEVKEFASDSQLSLLRIADPVATNLVQGYTNAKLIGDSLLTVVPMEKETGRFPAFGKEAFVLRGDLKRAVGGKVATLQTQNGYVTMSLDEYALGCEIEKREMNEWAGSPDQLVNGKLMQVTDSIMLYKEYLQATALTTYTNYATGHHQTGASLKWATDGDPIVDFETYVREPIEKANGKGPNKAWFNQTAWRLFRNNAQVLNRIKYGGSAITPAQMSLKAAAELLEVDEVLVGKAVEGYSGALGADGAPKKSAVTGRYLWEKANSSAMGGLIVGNGSGIEPAFGYTWTRKNSPIVESWYKNENKSQRWDSEYFFNAAVTLNSAGAIIYSIA